MRNSYIFDFDFGFSLKGVASSLQTIFGQAAFFAPLTTSLFFRGTGTPTFTRASTATQTDFEGNTHQALSGEARFQGARRVQNLLSYTEDFTNAVWDYITGGSGSGNLIVTNNYALAPDGTMTACRVQMNIGSGTTSSDYNILRELITGANVVESMYVKLNSGQPAIIRLFDSIQPTVTSIWTRYSSPIVISPSDMRIAQIQGNIGTAKQIDLLVWHPQAESVTGQSDQNPSEYVSVGVLSAPYHGAGVDGVQYFNYLNGNTVSSNVVTEAQGAPIPAATLLGCLPEPASTNYFLNSGAPVTQIITLAAGTYVTWMTGTGSITTSAGTATASGYGVASSGTPNTIVVTVGGTVVFTVGGTVTTGTVESNVLNKPTSYNPTTSAAVTRAADLDSEPTSGNIVAAQGSLYLEFTPNHAPSGTIYLWGTYVDANNSTSILHDGTNLIFRKRIAGVNYDATIALAFVSGTTYKVAASWGAAGTNIYLNGVAGTPNANTTAAQIGTTMQEGADGNGAGQPAAQLRNRRTWVSQLPTATLGAITQ